MSAINITISEDSFKELLSLKEVADNFTYYGMPVTANLVEHEEYIELSGVFRFEKDKNVSS